MTTRPLAILTMTLAVLLTAATPTEAAAGYPPLWHHAVTNVGPSASGYTVAWSPWFAPSKNHRWNMNLAAINTDYRYFPTDCRASVIAVGVHNHHIMRITATNYDPEHYDVFDQGTTIGVFHHWGKVRFRVAVWAARYFGPEASVCKASMEGWRS